MFTEQMTEALGLADKLDPLARAANTYTSLGVDMSRGKRVMYEIQIGAITGAGTLDANLQYSNTSNFATATNMTNTNITQITNAATNCSVTIEARSDQVTQQGGASARYVRLRVVTATNTVLFGATGWAGDGVQKPLNNTTYGSQLNSTLVPQRLVCNT